MEGHRLCASGDNEGSGPLPLQYLKTKDYIFLYVTKIRTDTDRFFGEI